MCKFPPRSCLPYAHLAGQPCQLEGHTALWSYRLVTRMVHPRERKPVVHIDADMHIGAIDESCVTYVPIWEITHDL